MSILVLGNPNVGKSALFNALTGEKAQVGNYPGVTVERHQGALRLGDETVAIADLPGAYSLSARSREEQITLEALLGLGGEAPPELVLLVVDATQLGRNLYLALQLSELRVPLVVAVNMIDQASPAPDVGRLTELLGAPCVGTDARRGAGVAALREAIGHARTTQPRARLFAAYPEPVRRAFDRVADVLPDAWVASDDSVERRRALSAWALMSLEADDELERIPPSLRERCEEVTADAAREGVDLDGLVIGERYRVIDELMGRLEGARTRPSMAATTERVDRVLLHPVLGFAIFLAIMIALFQTLFTGAEPLIGAVEGLVQQAQLSVGPVVPAGILRELIVQGIIGGVGNVIVFLPQIALLFLLLGLLEDSGYMARVAYLMDRIMRSVGLHGRAFVPMLSGNACAVPAILATRTMERRRDRLLTMLVIPLMTCSARMPVYSLIIVALFPPNPDWGWVPVQALLFVGLYLFSTVTALGAAGVLGRLVLPGKSVPLILELPPYRLPSARALLRQVQDRSTSFLREAGTVILMFTVVMWALLAFPRTPPAAPPAATPPEAAAAATPGKASKGAPDAAAPTTALGLGGPPPISESYGGRLGKFIEPAIRPLGFDWKLGVGLIGAFTAREVFISTMGLVYGLEDLDEDDPALLRERIKAERNARGEPAYPPLVGLSLMVFFALACQCMSTISVLYRETGTVRWPLFLFAYMTGLAWVASFLVYQGGRLLGFG